MEKPRMVKTDALVPNLTAQRLGHAPGLLADAALVLAGTAMISLLAQIAIPLPFTVVPLTGQTFGVTLIALLLGSRRATASVVTYLFAGAAGLPVFAYGAAGLALGPTLGYLAGMLVSAFVIGKLSDRGWTRSFKSALLAGFCGSLFVYAFGLAGISFFVPAEKLLIVGVLPFIPGDIIKTSLAAWIASSSHRRLEKRA
jgi:biotin transport system substrate-specific component